MCYKTQILCSLLVLLATVATVSSAGVASCSDGSALSSVALTFVKNVVGIGVNEYNVTSDCKGPMESLLYPGHTEALVSLILSDASSQLEMETEFIDSYMVAYRLTSFSGQTALAPGNSPDILKAAKETLGRYQTVFNVTYVSELAIMADNIASKDREQTVGVETATMRFEPHAGTGASFSWNYRNATRKSLGISINKEGVLDWFRDMWGIHKLSNSVVKVSEQAALKTASDSANAYAEQVGAAVAKMNITFGYINSYPNARGGDPFVLYPSWDVEFTFDRFYSDSEGQRIVGYFVGVWADTGNVRTAGPKGFWGESPQPSGIDSSPTSGFVIVASAIFVVGGAFVLTIRKRQKGRHAKK